jgi:diaminopimelate decarboxylase
VTPRRPRAGGAIELFPDTAEVVGEELTIGGVSASAVAAEQGTPLVVYCERTIRERARSYGAAVPDALVVYGAKAFPNVEVMRLLAEENVGADVSTLGELAFALRAGLRGERLIFHGNNKSGEELRAAADAGAFVVVDALEDVERCAEAGARRVLVRLKPAIEAATHPAIATAHRDSKFGLEPQDALAAVRLALEQGLDVVGVHVHVGSQLIRSDESTLAVDRLAELCRACRDELDWTPRLVDLGGGLGVAQVPGELVPDPAEFVRSLVARFRAAWAEPVRFVLEPGRSLVGQAGVTLYRVGVVKPQGSFVDVAVDGGMSDNPRPQLYGARYTALLANRADEAADVECRIVGKHCESGDVLIERVPLPRPRRGDLLAVPATGAYTLAMGSSYNVVPRPAAVLVLDGAARVIRERERVEDLLRLERA